MILDTNFQAWTYDTIRQIVQDYGLESKHFDYKAVLNVSRQGDAADSKFREQHYDSIRRTACSMANSAGGFIVFGVLDAKKAMSVEDRLAGMPIAGDLRKEFGDKVKSIDPSIGFDASSQPITHPDKPDKGFFVVQIPQSSTRPHLANHVFWTRGDGGTADQMNCQQVRDLMISTQAGVTRVRLMRQELINFRAIALTLQSAQLSLSEVMARSDVIAFKLLTSEISVFLPPDKDRASFTMTLLLVGREVQRLNELLAFYSNNVMMTEKLGWKTETTQAIRDCSKVVFNLADASLKRFDELFGVDPL